MSKYKPKDISCKRTDCFGNVKGVCSILTDTHFKNRECPFYKPKVKYEKVDE